MLSEFQKVLDHANLSSRKEDGVRKRRKITLHSFRRFVKTTIANQTRNSDYSEWFLGHFKSPYYTNKPEELKRIYKEDCMKYLTFLDYLTVEATGRSFEAQLKQKDREIEDLKNRIADLYSNTSEIQKLKQQVDEYKSVKTEMDNLTKMAFNIFDVLQKDKTQPAEQRRELFQKFIEGENKIKELLPKQVKMKEKILADE